MAHSNRTPKSTRPEVRAVASLFTAAFALALAGTAEADPLFPKMLKDAADMPCVPQCTVCHSDNQGGYGHFNAVSLGRTLQTFGLTVSDPSSLDPAVEADRAANSDLDGDGVGDIDELSAGDDPNPGGDKVCGNTVPEYGCARIDRHGSIDGAASAASAAVLILGVAVLRRRRPARP